MTDLAQLAGLDGLITPAVGEALRELAAQVPPGEAVVEVGAYHGKSTAYLAAGARLGVPVVAVDPWETVDVKRWCRHCRQPTLARFTAQLERVGLADRVFAWQTTSAVAAGEFSGPPIGLLHIDGDHSADALRNDLRVWEPHLAATAVVAVDDYQRTRNPDVKPAVDAWVVEHQAVMDTMADGRLAVIRWA